MARSWKLDHPYFRYILEERPEIQIDWCIRAVEQPMRMESQADADEILGQDRGVRRPILASHCAAGWGYLVQRIF
jgi:hypothetical protein